MLGGPFLCVAIRHEETEISIVYAIDPQPNFNSFWIFTPL